MKQNKASNKIKQDPSLLTSPICLTQLPRFSYLNSPFYPNIPTLNEGSRLNKNRFILLWSPHHLNMPDGPAFMRHFMRQYKLRGR